MYTHDTASTASGVLWYAKVQYHRDLAFLSLIGWKSTDIGEYGKYLWWVPSLEWLTQIFANLDPMETQIHRSLDPWVSQWINLFQPMGYPDLCSALAFGEINTVICCNGCQCLLTMGPKCHFDSKCCSIRQRGSFHPVTSPWALQASSLTF
jgi:hypothetical protein